MSLLLCYPVDLHQFLKNSSRRLGAQKTKRSQICFMKILGNFLKFILHLSAIFFIAGCQSFMSDNSKLIEPEAPAKKANHQQPEKDENSISLQRKFILPNLNTRT